MKYVLIIFSLLTAFETQASAYIGGQYGYSRYTSDITNKYKLNQKGAGYGGFFGFGKEFIGIEGFYQSLKTSGKVKHDGESDDFNTNAVAIGAALRLSFAFYYLRAGIGSYTLDQKITAQTTQTQQTADKVYQVEQGVKRNGVLLGAGLHKRFGEIVTFIDYSRHQISGAGNYDSISVGLSFNIPEKIFDFGKF